MKKIFAVIISYSILVCTGLSFSVQASDNPKETCSSGIKRTLKNATNNNSEKIEPARKRRKKDDGQASSLMRPANQSQSPLLSCPYEIITRILWYQNVAVSAGTVCKTLEIYRQYRDVPLLRAFKTAKEFQEYCKEPLYPKSGVKFNFPPNQNHFKNLNSLFLSLDALVFKVDKIDQERMVKIAPQLTIFEKLHELSLICVKSQGVTTKEIFDILVPAISQSTQLAKLEILPVGRGGEEMNEAIPLVSSKAINFFGVEFTKLKNLEVLNLARNRIGQQGSKDLIQLFGQLPKLHVLNLSGANIPRSDAMNLSFAIDTLTQLRDLDLTCTNLKSEEFCVVFPTLKTLTQLTRLALSGMAYGQDDDSSLPLAYAIGKLVQLQELILKQWDRKAENVRVIAAELSHLPYLKSFCFSDGKLDYPAICYLAPELGKLTQLKSLDLSRNEIHSVAMQPLTLALEKLTRLEVLCLQGNSTIGDAGISTLCLALGKLSCLRKINLSLTGIGYNAGRSLIPLTSQLINFQNLESLNLSGNSISDISELVKLTRLKRLGLANNSFIQEAGLMFFVSELKNFTQLEALSVPFIYNFWERVKTLKIKFPRLKDIRCYGYLDDI